jgi:hypothetical protein
VSLVGDAKLISFDIFMLRKELFYLTSEGGQFKMLYHFDMIKDKILGI